MKNEIITVSYNGKIGVTTGKSSQFKNGIVLATANAKTGEWCSMIAPKESVRIITDDSEVNEAVLSAKLFFESELKSSEYGLNNDPHNHQKMTDRILWCREWLHDLNQFILLHTMTGR